MFLKNASRQLLDYATACRQGLKCKRGVLECLAQTFKMVWREAGSLTDRSCADDTLVWRVEAPPVAPVFLENTRAT